MHETKKKKQLKHKHKRKLRNAIQTPPLYLNFQSKLTVRNS